MARRALKQPKGAPGEGHLEFLQAEGLAPTLTGFAVPPRLSSLKEKARPWKEKQQRASDRLWAASRARGDVSARHKPSEGVRQRAATCTEGWGCGVGSLARRTQPASLTLPGEARPQERARGLPCPPSQ